MRKFNPLSGPAAAIIVLMAIAAGYSTARAADIELSLRADKTRVGLDDYVKVEVGITSDSILSPPKPEINGIDDFIIAGEGTSQKISIVNMNVKRTSTHSYTLRPKVSGKTAKLMAILRYKGKTYKSNVIKVALVKSTGGRRAPPPAPSLPRGIPSPHGYQDPFKAFDRFFNNFGGRKNYRPDDFLLQARVNSARVYVGQEVIYTLGFYRARPIRGDSRYFMPDTKGFWRENIPEQARTQTRMEQVAGKKYAVTDASILLYPLTSGKITLGSGSMQFQPDAFSPAMKIESNEITLEVLPLPDKGKPQNFSGLVGRFDIKAEIDNRKTTVGKPLKLTVSIEGRGNVHAVPKPVEPDFANVEKYEPETKDSFNPTPDGDSGSRSFLYVLIPRAEGVLKIGSFETNFFDPENGRYVTVRTKPITVNVAPSAQQAGGIVPAPPAGTERAVLNLRQIKPDMEELSESTPYYRNRLFQGYLTALVLALLGAHLLLRRRRALEMEEKSRSKEPMQVAGRRLAKANGFISAGDGDALFREIDGALRGYIAAKLSMDVNEATRDEIRKRSNGINMDVTKELLQMLEKCETVRFGPIIAGKDEMRTMLEKSQSILKKLEKAQ
jgi:hypothetical protein